MLIINNDNNHDNDHDHQGKLAAELEGDVQGAQMAAKPFNLHAQIPAIRWLLHILVILLVIFIGESSCGFDDHCLQVRVCFSRGAGRHL